MRIYRIGSRAWGLASIGVMLLASLSIIGGAAIAVTREGASNAPLIVGFLSLFALFIIGFGIVMLRQVVEIRVRDDGTVEFVRPLGTTRITVWQIWVLEGTIGSDYGRTIWSLRVQHARGAMHFGEFRNVKHFAHRVKTLNPSVEISGVWPMGPP